MIYKYHEGKYSIGYIRYYWWILINQYYGAYILAIILKLINKIIRYYLRKYNLKINSPNHRQVNMMYK